MLNPVRHDGTGQIPILETERLRLRVPAAADLDSSAAMWGNPDVVRLIGGKPFTREEVWSRILRALGLWAMLGYGYWTVEEKLGGRFVGDVGFADFRRDMQPLIEGVPEIGWVLDPWSHGRGYASEAAAAAIAWGEANIAAPEHCCIVDSANTASLRVAEKVGFGAPEAAIYKGSPILLFRRPAQG